MDERFGRIRSFDNISVSRSVSNSDDVESNNHDHLNVITEQNLAEYILDRIKDMDMHQRQHRHKNRQHNCCFEEMFVPRN